MTITEQDALLFNNLFKNIYQQLPSVDSSKDYWFVRAQKGLFFESFRTGGYIAIGWNYITLEDLERLDEYYIKGMIKEFDKRIEKPGSAYKQMMKFANNLKIGDIVIVPSESPNDFLVGEITSRPYTESESVIESASNVCPFNKRINVHWFGIIPNRDIDPKLYKLVYSGHTITDANAYKNFINRGLYDAYIDHDHMSITFKVQEENNIDAFEYSTFLHTVLQMVNVVKESDELKDEKVVLRTNVQSEGPIELLGHPEILIPVLVFIIILTGGIAFRNLIKRNGANFEVDSKLGKFKAQLNSDGDEAIKKAQANKINAEAIALLIDKGMSPQFKGATSQLDIKAPEVATRILQDELLESPEKVEE